MKWTIGFPKTYAECFEGPGPRAFRLSKEKKRTKLQKLAEYLYEVKMTYESDEKKNSEEPYALVCRLLDDHCEIVSAKDDDAVNGDESGDNNSDDSNSSDSDGERSKTNNSSAVPEVRIQLLKKVRNPSISMQSPYDLDAGYSGHKGEGYFAHVTETCNNDSKEIITDYEVEPAGIDMNKDQKVIGNLREAGKQPEALYEDFNLMPKATATLKQRKLGLFLTDLIGNVSYSTRWITPIMVA